MHEHWRENAILPVPAMQNSPFRCLHRKFSLLACELSILFVSYARNYVIVISLINTQTVMSSCDDDYNLFKEKLIARIPKISIPLGNIPLL